MFNSFGEIQKFNNSLKFMIKEAIDRFSDNFFMPDIKYHKLKEEVEKISSNITNIDENCIAIIGDKSFELYASLFTCVLSDKTYIPISLSFDKDRIKEILNFTNTILVSPEAKEYIKKLDLNVNLIFIDELNHKILSNFVVKTQKQYLYILFTSGSTGKPKAIPISDENLLEYIKEISDICSIKQNDILSQTFDITFDLAMHDIFCAVLNGAKLVPIKKEQLFIPNQIIKKEKITIWFSVPSVVTYMDKLNVLRDNFSSIRLSLFCGEALPIYLVKKWAKLVNNSTIINLYGPTEATIAISYFQFDTDKKYPSSIVPIGKIFKNSNYIIKDGELLISSKQLFDKYLNTDENPFEIIKNKKFYKTGDLVKYDENFGLLYIGRKDEQIKLNGYRIELKEIENKAKELGVISVAIFNQKNNEIVLFSEKQIDLTNHLPSYMLPKQNIVIEQLPLNSNEKFDRKKLKGML